MGGMFLPWAKYQNVINIIILYKLLHVKEFVKGLLLVVYGLSISVSHPKAISKRRFRK